MVDDDPFGPWHSGPYGLYGPFLSALEAYRAQRLAEETQTIDDRLADARQARQKEQAAISRRLAQARRRRTADQAAQAERLHNQRRPAVEATPAPDQAESPATARSPQPRHVRPADHESAGSSALTDSAADHLPDPDTPALWDLCTLQQLQPSDRAAAPSDEQQGSGPHVP